MFIHCTAAIRVGAFWMIRRVLRDGFTLDAALEEARKVGLVPTPHLEEFARAYIDSRTSARRQATIRCGARRSTASRRATVRRSRCAG